MAKYWHSSPVGVKPFIAPAAPTQGEMAEETALPCSKGTLAVTGDAATSLTQEEEEMCLEDLSIQSSWEGAKEVFHADDHAEEEELDVEGGVRNVASNVCGKPPSQLPISASDLQQKVASPEVVAGDSANALERNPALLLVGTAVHHASYSWLEVTFGQRCALDMVGRQPHILATRADTAAATYGQLAAVFGELRARHMAVTAPYLLAMRWHVLQPKVEYLHGELGASLDDIAAAPSVLTCSLERRMKPRFRALRAAGRRYGALSTVLTPPDEVFYRRFGVRLADSPGCARPPPESHPAPARAGNSSSQVIDGWLEATFGQRDVLDMIKRQPRILATRAGTAAATYGEFMAAFGELRARRIAFKAPTLLAVRWQVLQPKVEYLRGGEVGASLDGIAAEPTVLNRSLERCIRPRFGALRAAGRRYGAISTVLKGSDEDFYRRYGVRPADGQGSNPKPGSEEKQG